MTIPGQAGEHSLKKLNSVCDAHQIQALDVGMPLYYPQYLVMRPGMVSACRLVVHGL